MNTPIFKELKDVQDFVENNFSLDLAKILTESKIKLKEKHARRMSSLNKEMQEYQNKFELQKLDFLKQLYFLNEAIKIYDDKIAKEPVERIVETSLDI